MASGFNIQLSFGLGEVKTANYHIVMQTRLAVKSSQVYWTAFCVSSWTPLSCILDLLAKIFFIREGGNIPPPRFGSWTTLLSDHRSGCLKWTGDLFVAENERTVRRRSSLIVKLLRRPTVITSVAAFIDHVATSGRDQRARN